MADQKSDKQVELLASSSLSPNPHSAIVPLRSIRRDPDNAKHHDAKQVQLVAASMERFGFLAPIVIDEDGMIVAGDGRYLAAKQLGLKQVPVVRARFLTEEDRTAYALADNKLAELSPWKDDVLSRQLNDLVAKNYDFGVTGFSLSDIDFSIPDEKVADETEAVVLPEPDERSVSRVGDLWLAGPHRLFNGDSQRPESFETALGGELARLVCSDPPYGVKVRHNVSTKATAREFVMMSGEQTTPELIAFFRAAFRNCARFSHEASIHYHFIDWRNLRHMLDAADGVYEEFKQLLVWVKSAGALGAFYRSRHELVCVFKSGRGQHINNFRMGETGRYRTNVLEHPGCSTFSKTRQRDLADHPSVKPSALIADLLLDCSNPGDVVLDPFCGSGTLLLAAAKVNRRGVGIELDPLYVDTALRRLRDATGLIATLAGDGRTFDEIAAERLSEQEA